MVRSLGFKIMNSSCAHRKPVWDKHALCTACRLESISNGVMAMTDDYCSKGSRFETSFGLNYLSLLLILCSQESLCSGCVLWSFPQWEATQRIIAHLSRSVSSSAPQPTGASQTLVATDQHVNSPGSGFYPLLSFSRNPIPCAS